MAAEVKQAVRELLDRLPDECTWDDVMPELYVRRVPRAACPPVRLITRSPLSRT